MLKFMLLNVRLKEEQSLKKIVIAIDGPAGSGKSTIAKSLSKRYGVYYLDTGSMYRAVAYKVIKESLDLSDDKTLNSLLNNFDLKISFDGDIQHTIIDGEDVGENIRTEEVSNKASDIATIEIIRIKLVEIQRSFVNEYGGIVDGRDIGSYVLPSADFKFYITANIEERANRRYKEYIEKGQEANIENLKIKMAERDAQDMGRKFAPLVKANDAIEIDTSGLTIEQVLNKILECIGENHE